MKENLDTKKLAREKVIKARASLDAFEYINLMRKKSPESLEFQPDGEVIINAVEGEIILENAKKALNLTSEEMMNYLINLADAIKQILLQ